MRKPDLRSLNGATVYAIASHNYTGLDLSSTDGWTAPCVAKDLPHRYRERAPTLTLFHDPEDELQ